jgi:hypothetical protein
MLSSRLKLLGTLTALLSSLHAQSIAAADQTWHQYENRHFVAYSDAPDKKSRALLMELERFRGAVLQVGNFLIPESAPKTKVLVLADAMEFSELAPSKYTAGFALRLNERTVIVIPISEEFVRAETVIRHEFVHALLRFKGFKYPTWYEEGFAELLSAMEFTKRGKSFTVGKATERAQYNGPLLYDWDKLVSDHFNPHSITGARHASSAYTQAWLLVHYTTLGDGFKNAQKLQQYFDLTKEGQSSIVAFKTAFGSSAGDLWRTELGAYAKGFSYYEVAFAADTLDEEFQHKLAEKAEVQFLIDYLRAYSIAFRNVEPPTDPLVKLPGTWDVLQIDKHCDDPGQIMLDKENSTLTFGHFSKNKQDEWEPETFTYELESSGHFFLLREENSMVLDGGYSWRLEMRGEGLFCFRRADWPDSRCGVIMTRCSQ